MLAPDEIEVRIRVSDWWRLPDDIRQEMQSCNFGDWMLVPKNGILTLQFARSHWEHFEEELRRVGA